MNTHRHKPVIRYMAAPIVRPDDLVCIDFLHLRPITGSYRVTIESPGQPNMREALLAVLDALEGTDEGALDAAAELAREALGMEGAE